MPGNLSERELWDMRRFWFIGRYLVWLGVTWPYLHVAKRRPRP